MWHGGRNGFQMRLLSDYYILTSAVYTCVLISTITVLRIQVVTLKPAHIWSCASTVIRVHLMSTPLCTLHQIWLIDLRRFQCYDPKPAVYAMLVLVRAKWLSSSTRPADARTKPAKKTKQKKNLTPDCFVHCKHTTCRYPPDLRRNARRWLRPPGSRNPDGFPPCSQLQHGLSTPELQPADKPADRTALRGTETLMDHKGCSWTHRRSANRYHLWLTAGRPGVDWPAVREDERRSWRKASTVQGRNNMGGGTSPHRLPNPPYTYLVKDCKSSLTLRRRKKENMHIVYFFCKWNWITITISLWC